MTTSSPKRLARNTERSDLHCHGLLSAPFSVYETIAGRPLSPPPARFENFDIFNRYLFKELLSNIRTSDHVRQIVRGCFERLVADCVSRAEVSFDLMIPDFVGMTLEEFVSLLETERKKLSRIRISFEIGLNRKMPVAEMIVRVEKWIETGVFSSLDLYDDERCGRLQDFVPIYRLAEQAGLKLKAHAGEFGPAASVREAVELLHLHAVQHGIRAVDDPAVMRFLAERGTPLNICPTSNVALGACPSYAAHPARKLFDAGVRLTVNTDDFALFGSTVGQELEHLAGMGFSEREILQIIENGLEL